MVLYEFDGDGFYVNFLQKFCDYASCDDCPFFKGCKFLNSLDFTVRYPAILDDDFDGYPF